MFCLHAAWGSFHCLHDGTGGQDMLISAVILDGESMRATSSVLPELKRIFTGIEIVENCDVSRFPNRPAFCLPLIQLQNPVDVLLGNVV